MESPNQRTDGEGGMTWVRWKLGGYLMVLVVWYILPRSTAQQSLKGYVMRWSNEWRERLVAKKTPER